MDYLYVCNMYRTQTKENTIKLVGNLGESIHNYTFDQLAEMIGTSSRSLRGYLNELGIKKIHSPSKVSAISPNGEVEELISQGLSSGQIAKQLNLKVRQITCYRNVNNLGSDNSNKSRRGLPIKLAAEEEQVVIGSLLGDGCIDLNNRERGYCRLTIKHGPKQEEYIKYKQNLLSRFSSPVVSKFRKDKREKFKDHTTLYFTTTTDPLFKEYRDKWYTSEGKKFICREDFDRIDYLGLSIWIMDDGNLNGGIDLATHCFSLEDISYMKNVLESKFGINVHVRESPNILYITAESLSKIKPHIEKHFPESMKYKISKNYKKSE